MHIYIYTTYSIVEYNGAIVSWDIAFQSAALDCRGGTQCIALKSDALGFFGGGDGYFLERGPIFSSKGRLFQYGCLFILIIFSKCPFLGNGK